VSNWLERMREVVFGDSEAARSSADDEVLAFYEYHRAKRGDNDPETEMWRQAAGQVQQRRESPG
jgi:hypothetical protein